MFMECGNRITLAIPLRHEIGTVVLRRRFGGVTPNGLVKGDSVIKAGGLTTVIADECGQHLAVLGFAHDALDDNMVTMIKRVPGGEINETDRRIHGLIANAQDIAPEDVLADDREAATVATSNLPGGGRLTAGTIAAQDDEARLA